MVQEEGIFFVQTPSLVRLGGTSGSTGVRGLLGTERVGFSHKEVDFYRTLPGLGLKVVDS